MNKTRRFLNHESRLKRSLTPEWSLTPRLLRSYVWLYPRIIVSKSHENTSKYVDTVTFFAKNLNQRSLTPRWHLTPHLLRSHVWLYPRIILSKSHENTSKYVDTVTLLAKTWTKRSLTPRWPLTPHLLRSHVWLYPRIVVSKSHGNTSMYVDTVINFANYRIHTTYRMSDHIDSLFLNYVQASLFLNYVQARQKLMLIPCLHTYFKNSNNMI